MSEYARIAACTDDNFCVMRCLDQMGSRYFNSLCTKSWRRDGVLPHAGCCFAWCNNGRVNWSDCGNCEKLVNIDILSGECSAHHIV